MLNIIYSIIFVLIAYLGFGYLWLGYVAGMHLAEDFLNITSNSLDSRVRWRLIGILTFIVSIPMFLISLRSYTTKSKYI